LAEAAGDLVPVAPRVRDRIELGEAIVKTMDGRGACLMANHGLIALGRTLEAAFSTAWQIEDVAQVYSVALALGEPKTLSHEEATRIREFFLTRYGQHAWKKPESKT
jgi:L-fuculose-phosphate aldolase